MINKKMSTILTVTSLFVLVLCTTPLMAGKDFLKNNWQSVSEYYMEAANLMPEEHFGFKPTKEIFSYAEQLLHVAGGNFFFAAKVKGDKPPKPEDAFKAEGKSKKEVVALLKESFDYVINVIDQLPEEKIKSKIEFGKKQMPISQILLFASEHAIHHRGQMIIYLRLKGITPPKYRSGFLQ